MNDTIMTLLGEFEFANWPMRHWKLGKKIYLAWVEFQHRIGNPVEIEYAGELIRKKVQHSGAIIYFEGVKSSKVHMGPGTEFIELETAYSLITQRMPDWYKYRPMVATCAWNKKKNELPDLTNLKSFVKCPEAC